MTLVSANRLYLSLRDRFFFLSKIARPVPQVIIVHREHAGRWRRRRRWPGYANLQGFAVGWDQVFLTVATRLSASGPRSRSRPTKTSHPVPKKSLCKCAAEARPRPRRRRRRCSVGHRYIRNESCNSITLWRFSVWKSEGVQGKNLEGRKKRSNKFPERYGSILRSFFIRRGSGNSMSN